MDITMKEPQLFILHFVEKEAEAWTRREQGDLNAYNYSVKELYDLAIEELDEAFGILIKKELKHSTTFKCNPRLLFKLSKYRNDLYGDIWVAYTSMKNPDTESPGGLSEGYIISIVDGELKIVGHMWLALDELYMEPSNWEASMYNPSNIDIHNLGEFIYAERYKQPDDDGFSVEDYLKDK
jgi:hypothetical protein